MFHERDQVAEVFGLVGGDFEDAPWTPSYVSDSGETRPFTYTYWYTGVPDYTRELDTCAEIRTVCRDETFGQVPEAVTDESGTWRVIARFSTAGEIGCPGQHCGMPLPCTLCEETDEHGYIYIGDGWSEIVYQLDADRSV